MHEQEQPEAQPVQIAAPSPKDDDSQYPRACPHCSKSFPTSTRYHKHLRTHSGSKECRCTFPGCGKSYKRKTHLMRHLATHRVDKPFRCTAETCTMSFVTRQKLERHIKSVHTGLRCADCGQRFKKKAKLERHRQLVHRSPRQPGAAVAAPAAGKVCCPECPMEFASMASLERHISRSHRPGSRKFTCRQCEETFGSFKELVCHRRQLHAKTYVCDECGQGFKKSCHLRDHKDRVHRQAVVLCQQPGCLQTFATKAAMRQHFRVAHMGLQEFACRLCPKKFAYKHVLRLHCQKEHCTHEAPSSERLQKDDLEKQEMKRIKSISPADLLAELFAETLPQDTVKA